MKYHLGWKLASNLKLRQDGFHPTTSAYFRQRLIEHGKAELAMSAVLAPFAERRVSCETF